MFSEEDQGFMQRALELANMAAGRTSPNPMVGAVLVRDGIVVGEGYHEKAGQAHAEIRALAAAGSRAKEATLYINLEPCCHQGRTPPCTEALINAGISKAVVAMVDPNPLVSGQGLTRLRGAGIEVVTGLLEKQARRMNEAFVKLIETGRPLVTIKTAMTMDGKIASSTGDSRWISGEQSRAYAHEMRNRADAILVGIGTVLQDDPMLNTRLPEGNGRNPLRVILDSELEIPVGSRIVQSAGEIATVLYCSPGADESREKHLRQQGLEIFRLSGAGGLLDLNLVLENLGQRGICNLMVEGGARVNASLLLEGLVDKVVWIIAPRILGGAMAPSPVGGPGISKVDDAIGLVDLETRFIGEDLCISAYVDYHGSRIQRGY